MINYKLASRAFFLLLLALSATMPCWASMVMIKYDLTGLPDEAQKGSLYLNLKNDRFERNLTTDLEHSGLIGENGRGGISAGKYDIESFVIIGLGGFRLPVKCKTEGHTDIKTIDFPSIRSEVQFDLKYSIQTKKVDCLLSYE